MKKLIIAVSIVLWFSVACVNAGTIYIMDDPETLSAKDKARRQEVIQYFIDSGDVCKVIGHIWEENIELSSDPYIRFSYYLNQDGSVYYWGSRKIRTCKMCGLKQKEVSMTEKVEVEREVKQWFNVE